MAELEQDLYMAIKQIVKFFLQNIVDLINTSPKDWAESMKIWDDITEIYNNILPLACSLVVLFFLIGFCENSINVKEEIRLEIIFRLFIRVGITQYFVIHALEIANIIFDISTGLCGTLRIPSYKTVFDNGLPLEIYDTNWIGNIFLIFPLMFMLVIAPACMFIIWSMLIMRFFRILLAIPYGALAFSGLASGSHHFSNIAPGYVKYMLSICLEAFSIGIALKIGTGVIINAHGLVSFVQMEGDVHFINAVLEIVQYCLSTALLLILCKAAQNTATKALSLDR